MLAFRLSKDLKLNLPMIDKYINENIPSGYEENKELQLPEEEIDNLLNGLKCKDKLLGLNRIKKSLGSLGGGNHFIEIDKADSGDYWLVIHSGSRNLGSQVAEIYQDIADENINKSKQRRLEARENIIKTLKEENRAKEIEASLKEFDKTWVDEKIIEHDLCYLQGQDMLDYLHDSYICETYAHKSRLSMAIRIIELILNCNYSSVNRLNIDDEDNKDIKLKYLIDNNDYIIEGFETLHNHIGKDKILRKGAISAYEGEKVLIPINMRDGSIIAIGKSNKEYNYSAPHGAGRLLSRKDAMEKINIEDFKKSMIGIYSTSVCKDTIDESPFAYKPIEDILANIKDTVDVLEIIKPIYNFKAHGNNRNK